MRPPPGTGAWRGPLDSQWQKGRHVQKKDPPPLSCIHAPHRLPMIQQKQSEDDKDNPKCIEEIDNTIPPWSTFRESKPRSLQEIGGDTSQPLQKINTTIPPWSTFRGSKPRSLQGNGGDTSQPLEKINTTIPPWSTFRGSKPKYLQAR